jgi:uncharacterized phage-associated protein
MFETKTKLVKTDLQLIAKYISLKIGKMSHLKLQKLLYYCYAMHLAYFEEELFDGDFEAWIHGPVSRELWNTVREHSLLYDDIKYNISKGEVNPIETVEKTLTSDQLQLIDDTLSELGKLTGFELENMTHSEDPWINARKGVTPGDRCNEKIDKDLIKAYYKSWFSV